MPLINVAVCNCHFYNTFVDLSAKDAAKELGVILLVQLVCVIISLGVVVLLAFIYDAAYRSMSWFSNPWMLFGIYVCPMFFCLGMGPSLYIMYSKKVYRKLGCSMGK